MFSLARREALRAVSLSCPADEARHIDAISASRAARGRRRRRMQRERACSIGAVQAATVRCNRADRATAYAETHRNLALRMLALFEQSIDFVNQRRRKHLVIG